MRVLIVSAYFRPHVGGVERFVETLAAGLARRGHDVTVLCCRTEPGSPSNEELDGYRVERVPATNVIERRLEVPYPIPSPLALRRSLARLVQSHDIVHVQDALYLSSVVALLTCRRTHAPCVVTEHVAFVSQRSRVLDTVERIALATFGRCIRFATVVATYNAAVAEWVKTTWGIRDVRVLPVGVATRARGADRGELRRSFRLPPDRFVALFVGRDVPKKGLDVFLAATDPAYDLVAVTNRRRDPSSATLVPFMSPDRLGDLLHCVDAFVLPSKGEGFPISIQEALAGGLPVVTTLQPGYERFLSPEDVLYVERTPESVRNALLRLVDEPTLRQRLSERGLAVAEQHFGVERFVTAYEKIYEEAGQSSSRMRDA